MTNHRSVRKFSESHPEIIAFKKLLVEVKKKGDQEAIKKMEDFMSPIIVNNELIADDIYFEYGNDQLVSVIDGNQEFKFFYDVGSLSRSEFYVNGTLYNTRKYIYKDGLKDRTEVLNVNGEPEFTIHYDYKFYEN